MGKSIDVFVIRGYGYKLASDEGKNDSSWHSSVHSSHLTQSHMNKNEPRYAGTEGFTENPDINHLRMSSAFDKMMQPVRAIENPTSCVIEGALTRVALSPSERVMNTWTY